MPGQITGSREEGTIGLVDPYQEAQKERFLDGESWEVERSPLPLPYRPHSGEKGKIALFKEKNRDHTWRR